MIKHIQKKRSVVIRKYLTYLIIIFYLSSCNKLVEIPPPSNSITTSQVLGDSADAAAAISGIYSKIQYGKRGLASCNGAETIICGLSSDEFISFDPNNYF